MSQSELDVGETRQFLMQRGWSLEETVQLEATVADDFNVRMLHGLGADTVAELRLQLGAPGGGFGPPESDGRADFTHTADSELVCVFTGIGKGTHKSEKNPVQRQPFSRIGKDGKWVEMKKPRQPICESCTATLRKHYTHATNSPELTAAFVHEIESYKCRECGTWNDGGTAVRASNLCCTACSWTGGKKKKTGPRAAARSSKPVAHPTMVAEMLGGGGVRPPARAQRAAGRGAMLPPGLPPPAAGWGAPPLMPPPLGQQLSRPSSHNTAPVPRRITGGVSTPFFSTFTPMFTPFSSILLHFYSSLYNQAAPTTA